MIPHGLLVAMGGGGRGMVLSITDSSMNGEEQGFAQSGFVATTSPSFTTVSVVSGGVGPFTYAWTLNGTPATSGPFNPTAAGSASTGWNATVDSLDIDSTESWRCRVTDTGDSNKTKDIFCNVTLVWIDLN
jgi:hypothetical protein